MKKVSRVLVLLMILLALLLGWRFLRMRGGRIENVAVQQDFHYFMTLPFFSLGSVAITPQLLCIVVGALVLIALSSSVAKRGMNRLLAGTTLDDGQKYAIEIGTGYLVFFIGLVVLLQSAGLNLSSLAVLGGALGVGVGFGLQNIFNNFVSGLILLIERPIKLGDRVEVGNLLGDIVRIGARSTWVRTNDGIIIIAPNSDFIANRVTNWTAGGRQTRFTIPIGVAYGSEPQKVRDILLRVAAENADVMKTPGPDVIIKEFADSSINFALRVWTVSQIQNPGVLKSDLYFAIHKAFLENNIELPFPQRDLHIRSSIAIPIMETAERSS